MGSLVVTSDRATSLEKMEGDHPDTVPGFMMQSQNFVLKFITGLQKGVVSKLLEMETDWFDMMEIMLSRLEDEPTNQERLEDICARDLEHWALLQPGGDTLNLQIKVELDEHLCRKVPANSRNLQQHPPKPGHLGTRKAVKLTFNDRFTTQVIFHVRKKRALQSLKELAAVAFVDLHSNPNAGKELAEEGLLPSTLVPDLDSAFSNCWTKRSARSQLYKCCATLHPTWPSTCLCEGEKKSAKAEEDRRQALLTLERKAKRRKAEAALAEMRERAERNESVIRRNGDNADNVGVLTRSRVAKSGVLRSAKLKLSGKPSQCSAVKEIDSKTENLRSKIEDMESKITREQSVQEKEEYSRLQERFKKLQETFEQLKRKEKEAKVEKKIKVLKDKYAALQQKIRNMKKNCTENETYEESESSVSKKKLVGNE